MPTFERVRSGQAGVDSLVDSIRMGDNVVWQLDDLSQYAKFVEPFVRQAVDDKRNLHYIRFSHHPPLLSERKGLTVQAFDPELGFETFTHRLHEYIGREGRDAFYVFDSLSGLQTAWASDIMMGCFFQVTCPYLFELNTVAFFGVIRNRHSFEALARIRDTTQLLLDVYGPPESPYIQPLKVWNRHHPAMFTPHRLSGDGERSLPLTDPIEAARFHAILNEQGVAPLAGQLDYWDRTFLKARQNLEDGVDDDAFRARLCDMLLGRDERIAAMARRHFRTADYLRIKDRMIGSGSVGGKSVGMLLARKVVENGLPGLARRIEPHDSFYIGSDVFYAFLVENGWWRLRLRQRTRDGFLTAAGELRDRIAAGRFPVQMGEQFRRMLEYFGQRPIIVRSSSLLEDSFGNAFAGKYDSVFLANTGSAEERLAVLEKAIREVYASAMSPSALAYRLQRGLADRDEQMAILVQRVSGSDYAGYFMPCAAGVAHSSNPYVWDERIDPDAGMVRLVAGLGTRAVDRSESDYPRLVSLNVPELVPFGDAEDAVRYSQKWVDVVDLAAGGLATIALGDAIARWPARLRNLVCERDYEAERFYDERGVHKDVYFCNCGRMVSEGGFCRDMRDILACLKTGYDYPVDVEFAVNYGTGDETGDEYVINILQCRPLQIRGQGVEVALPRLPEEDLLFSLDGNTMGGGADMRLEYVVTVDPAKYANLDMSGKYETARTIGRINQALSAGKKGAIMLMGPGRWGTRSPDLGVPVNFAEICGIAALCEVSMTDGSARPDLSFGSHFFQDLVEARIFFAAIMPERGDCLYRPEALARLPDIVRALPAGTAPEGSPVRVHDAGGANLWLKADVPSGKCVCGFMP